MGRVTSETLALRNMLIRLALVVSGFINHASPSCSPPTDSSISWIDDCPTMTNVMYGLSDIELPASDALNYCRDIGANLVSAWNVEVDTCVNKVLRDVSGGATIQAIIGARYKPENDAWSWADGEHVINSTSSTYNNCKNDLASGRVCNTIDPDT